MRLSLLYYQKTQDTNFMTSSNLPLFSLLILNYKGLEHVKELCQSLATQSLMNFEIVFVDNNSEDDSVEWVQSFLASHHIPGVSLQSGSNLGFAGGNNYGIPHCRGEWVFFLNNDTVVDEDFMESLQEYVQANSDYRVFGPLLYQYTQRDLIDTAGDGLYTSGPAYQTCHSKKAKSIPNRPFETVSVCGGAAIYHREVLDLIGFFDEDFWLIYEDIDLSYRAQNHGFKILMLPACRVYHKGGESIGKVSPMRYHFEMRNMHFVRIKNFPVLTLLRYYPQVFLQYCLVLGFALKRGQLVEFLHFKWQAWRRYPKMWQKRKAARGAQPLSFKQFDQLLKKGWFRSRLSQK